MPSPSPQDKTPQIKRNEAFPWLYAPRPAVIVRESKNVTWVMHEPISARDPARPLPPDKTH